MRLKKKCLVFLLLSLVFCCSFSGCSKKNDASYTPDFRIYLMRHGQTVDNATGILAGSGTDSELNEIGVEQAEEAGKALDQLGIHFQAAYSSPLKRAQSTAKLVLACNETDNIQNVTIADDLIMLEQLMEMLLMNIYRASLMTILRILLKLRQRHILCQDFQMGLMKSLI